MHTRMDQTSIPISLNQEIGSNRSRPPVTVLSGFLREWAQAGVVSDVNPTGMWWAVVPREPFFSGRTK